MHGLHFGLQFRTPQNLRLNHQVLSWIPDHRLPGFFFRVTPHNMGAKIFQERCADGARPVTNLPLFLGTIHVPEGHLSHFCNKM
jgi:hypothetical protein